MGYIIFLSNKGAKMSISNKKHILITAELLNLQKDKIHITACLYPEIQKDCSDCFTSGYIAKIKLNAKDNGLHRIFLDDGKPEGFYINEIESITLTKTIVAV